MLRVSIINIGNLCKVVVAQRFEYDSKIAPTIAINFCIMTENNITNKLTKPNFEKDFVSRKRDGTPIFAYFQKRLEGFSPIFVFKLSLLLVINSRKPHVSINSWWFLVFRPLKVLSIFSFLLPYQVPWPYDS